MRISRGTIRFVGEKGEGKYMVKFIGEQQYGV